ncbi:MAG TPA: DUF6159 family protein [Solirubrobacterales bacterium]
MLADTVRVEASQLGDGASANEGRISRGWRLTGAAWRLMRRDPTMIAIALLGAGCAIGGAAIVLYLSGSFSSSQHSRASLALVWLIALYPLTFVSVFFNVALASAAAAHFDGGRLSVGEALGAAYERIDRIAGWALLSAVVGLLLGEVARRLPGGGRIVTWLVGAAWGLGTIFAVPLMTLEDAGPVEAMRGSMHLLKSRWGEGLSGVVGITAWTVLVAFPAGVLIAIGAAENQANPGAGIAMIAIGLIALVVVAALATATRQVFAVALFRYATDAPTAGFAGADLEHPFAFKKQGRRTHPIAWVALGLIVALIGLAAILHPKGAVRGGAEGYSHVSFAANPRNEAEIQDGMPVLYLGRRVGYVVEHRLEGSEIFIVYYVDPGNLEVPASGLTELSYAQPTRPYIRLLPSGASS